MGEGDLGRTFMMRTFLIILTLLIVPIISIYADETVCDICSKNIEGEFFKVGAKVYCSHACVLADRPACTVCGKKVLNGGYRFQGKFVCSDGCLDRARPRCTVCKKPVIGGKGVKSDGIMYCSPDCWKTTLPACVLCGKRTEQVFSIHDRVFCPVCHATPKCAQCSAPAGENVLPDGRPYCTVCRPKGITERGDALAYYLDVKRIMKGAFGIETDDAITFHLVDMNEFQKINGSDSVEENGLYRATTTVTVTSVSLFGVEMKREQDDEAESDKHIYILSWLDRQHFRRVAAHELMHDWTHDNHPEVEDDIMIEGLSEYMAYLINEHFGARELNKLLESNEDPVYGAGFRLVQSADKGKGMKDILDWLDSGDWRKDLAELKAKQEAKKL